MPHAHTVTGVDAARERFFRAGDRSSGLVPKVILDSWQRCAARGLAARARPEVEPLAPAALLEMQERYQALHRLCRPELEALHASARAAGAIAILTGPDGLILDAVGDAHFLDKAARVSLRPGVPWGEEACGTNAIGTALVEKRPVEVLGGEHFFEPYRILSCSAAPILDPTGKLVGVLDLSGESSVHHPHALGMVQMAVDQIEHRLFDEISSGRDFVRLHTDAALLGTPREGVLMFEGHRLVAANRHALKMLGLDWDELGRRRYDELFSSGLPRAGSSGSLRDLYGNILHARRAERQELRASRIAPMGRRPAAPHPKPVIDPATEQQLVRAVRLLDADIPVLLHGETGTGKEVFARALHQRSSRSAHAFVAINCAALPENLIESELFGYAPGAFTGARQQGSRGLLREADGGVLFLDEIGDMPLGLQCRLLRVLQEREVTAVGSTQATPVDFALVAASHRDLHAAVEAGAFRADLYYRIAQTCVNLLPVRDHADLRGLVLRLWSSLGADDAQLSMSEAVLDVLAGCNWPGNFRQLTGVLRSLVALSDAGTTVTVDMLPDLYGTTTSVPRAPLAVAPLNVLERDAMRSALVASGGNASEAARKLGINRSTLYRRLRIDAKH